MAVSIDACDYCNLGQEGRCHEVVKNCPVSQDNGDEEAGEPNFRKSAERVQAVCDMGYNESPGTAQWDAWVLLREVNRLQRIRFLGYQG